MDLSAHSRDVLIHRIATELDKPSVYMGGPSKRSTRLAAQVVRITDNHYRGAVSARDTAKAREEALEQTITELHDELEMERDPNCEGSLAYRVSGLVDQLAELRGAVDERRWTITTSHDVTDELGQTFRRLATVRGPDIPPGESVEVVPAPARGAVDPHEHDSLYAAWAEAEREAIRLRNAAARALERCEVADDPSGAADEAAAILREVVNLDGSPAERGAVGD